MKGLELFFQGDKRIWGILIVLFIVNIALAYTTTVPLDMRSSHGVEHYFFYKQLKFSLIGLGIIFAFHHINYQVFSKLAFWIYVLSIVLLLITAVVGKGEHGAKRWLEIPFVHIQFETSDFARFALFLYLSLRMSVNQKEIKNFSEVLISLFAPTLLTCIFIIPFNLSTGLIILISATILYYIGRVDFKHILSLAGISVLFLVAITLFSMVFHVGRPRTWVSRIVTHWEKQKRSADKKNPYGTTAEEKTRNWQSRQSEIAIANSNYVGVGMGRSKQVIFLPQADSDFLFSIIIEQFGVWGSALLLMIYLSLLWFVMQLFDSFKYAFGSIFSVGYCIVFVFQALVHMAINVGIFPVTGLTLPLVSTGGTSILINSMAFGLILSISRSAKQMAKDAQNAVKQATENTNLNPANDTTSFPTPIPIINPNNNKTY